MKCLLSIISKSLTVTVHLLFSVFETAFQLHCLLQRTTQHRLCDNVAETGNITSWGTAICALPLEDD